jgi:hypothetical protein
MDATPGLRALAPPAANPLKCREFRQTGPWTLLLAMQKVVGSNPISRFARSAGLNLRAGISDRNIRPLRRICLSRCVGDYRILKSKQSKKANPS